MFKIAVWIGLLCCFCCLGCSISESPLEIDLVGDPWRGEAILCWLYVPMQGSRLPEDSLIVVKAEGYRFFSKPSWQTILSLEEEEALWQESQGRFFVLSSDRPTIIRLRLFEKIPPLREETYHRTPEGEIIYVGLKTRESREQILEIHAHRCQEQDTPIEMTSKALFRLPRTQGPRFFHFKLICYNINEQN